MGGFGGEEEDSGIALNGEVSSIGAPSECRGRDAIDAELLGEFVGAEVPHFDGAVRGGCGEEGKVRVPSCGDDFTLMDEDLLFDSEGLCVSDAHTHVGACFGDVSTIGRYGDGDGIRSGVFCEVFAGGGIPQDELFEVCAFFGLTTKREGELNGFGCIDPFSGDGIVEREIAALELGETLAGPRVEDFRADPNGGALGIEADVVGKSGEWKVALGSFDWKGLSEFEGVIFLYDKALCE